ncbi:AAA family ATPase [Vibrio methylphosphonaticus]|uniref:AAA family ATPase n=1 Tax=Vibrio methylphosphonaticus TaxID=2946866 RepID=UPI00202A885C|nr:AAA family ATPase [Vibrio methylphosphonaticus]MCL9776468.1 AAA family ATPase [Vibrio methylphosphonaticus]
MNTTLPFIVTGGPGSGKTTLLESIECEDTQVFPEVPRQLIIEQSQIANGILPWVDLSGFAELCFREMLTQKHAALDSPLTFLDRAIPDICAYLSWGNLEIPQHIALEASSGYQQLVIFCEPTLETYVQDEIRPYPFEEALAIHKKLYALYESMGYQIVSLPLLPIKERKALLSSICREYLRAV